MPDLGDDFCYRGDKWHCWGVTAVRTDPLELFAHRINDGDDTMRHQARFLFYTRIEGFGGRVIREESLERIPIGRREDQYKAIKENR